MEDSSDYQEEEDKVMSKIKELVPDWESQIQAQIVSQLAKNNKIAIERKKQQIKEHYTQKLKQKVVQINKEIRTELDELKNESVKLKQQGKRIKKRKLTKEEEEDLIEETVTQILQNQKMVEKIKKEMYDQVEEKVLRTFQISMNNDLEEIRCQQDEKYRMQRQEWEKERYEFWKGESERDLEELAQQYKELEYKKTLIQESLQAKKLQKERVRRKHQALTQHNNQVAEIKRQIKMLS